MKDARKYPSTSSCFSTPALTSRYHNIHKQQGSIRMPAPVALNATAHLVCARWESNLEAREVAVVEGHIAVHNLAKRVRRELLDGG